MLAPAREAGKIAMGHQKRLLDQVRRLQLQAQANPHHRASHQAQVVAIQIQQRSQRRPIAGAGLHDQEIGIRIANHGPVPIVVFVTIRVMGLAVEITLRVTAIDEGLPASVLHPLHDRRQTEAIFTP